MVPLECHLGTRHVERDQLHCDRRVDLRGFVWRRIWAWKQDPNMLEILRASAQFRARYDPGKWAAAPWTLLIRR